MAVAVDFLEIAADGAGKKIDLTDPTAPSPRGGGGGGALYAAYENSSLIS